MEIDKAKIQKLVYLLKDAAKNERVILYHMIYDVFEKNTLNSTVWETFEMACKEIADNKTAIYGALLAMKGDGLPSTGFFDVFKCIRNSEYLVFTNGRECASNALNVNEKTYISGFERKRVYAHAIENQI